MIRGVIFDLGNTLLYFNGEWQSVIRAGAENIVRFLNERGYPLPDDLAESFLAVREQSRGTASRTNREYTAEQALQDTLAKHGVCYVPDRLVPLAIAKYFEPESAHWIAYDDARTTLEQLRARGLKIAVFSNATSQAWVEHICRTRNIAEFFEPLLSSAAFGTRKPDPRAFQPILDAWQLPPDEIVVVGDDPSYDILGAHRAGMRGVLIEERWSEPPMPHDEFKDAHLMQSDAVIRQLGELPTLLDAWKNRRNP